ncbi:MAG: hypothetical protein GY714_06305 [Desulfobacterales bacterium]|nr:hypothetical protein [Desulfobacterales bacterium]
MVWVPKYRLKILTGKVADEVNHCVRSFSEELKCELVEQNIQMTMSIFL